MNKLTTQKALSATEQLLSLWLHGKSPRTQEYYRFYAMRFLSFVGKPLHLVTLAEVQGFATSLEHRFSNQSPGTIQHWATANSVRIPKILREID